MINAYLKEGKGRNKREKTVIVKINAIFRIRKSLQDKPDPRK